MQDADLRAGACLALEGMIDEAFSLCSNFEVSARSPTYKTFARVCVLFFGCFCVFYVFNQNGLNTMEDAKNRFLKALRPIKSESPKPSDYAEVEAALDAFFASLQYLMDANESEG